MNDSGKWMKSGDAVRLLLRNSMLVNPAADLHRRLRAGLLRAKADRYEDENGSEEHVDVPQGFWQGEIDFPHGSWVSGDFEDRQRAAYGVQFEREGVFSLNQSSDEKTYGRRGDWATRRKDFWDDMLIEIARALYTADLQVKWQADLEEYMLDWAARHDHEVSTSSVRTRARKLWQAIFAEDK